MGSECEIIPHYCGAVMDVTGGLAAQREQRVITTHAPELSVRRPRTASRVGHMGGATRSGRAAYYSGQLAEYLLQLGSAAAPFIMEVRKKV